MLLKQSHGWSSQSFPQTVVHRGVRLRSTVGIAEQVSSAHVTCACCDVRNPCVKAGRGLSLQLSLIELSQVVKQQLAVVLCVAKPANFKFLLPVLSETGKVIFHIEKTNTEQCITLYWMPASESCPFQSHWLTVARPS